MIIPWQDPIQTKIALLPQAVCSGLGEICTLGSNPFFFGILHTEEYDKLKDNFFLSLVS